MKTSDAIPRKRADRILVFFPKENAVWNKKVIWNGKIF
jgi:hypothetical protein